MCAESRDNLGFIPIEMLPAEVLPDEKHLVEITDSKVLARVNNLVPGLAQAGNAANNAAQAVQAKKIADFQTEILENDELRLSKISQLDSLEEECTKLLGQANLTLAGFAKRTGLDYEAYEKALGEAQNWFMYQKSLVDVLCKISDLRYTFQKSGHGDIHFPDESELYGADVQLISKGGIVYYLPNANEASSESTDTQ